jgi:hypothetical protein
VSPVMMEEDDSATFLATNSDNDSDGGTDEVKTWARGCLYSCELCNVDFAGLKVFELHLATSHQMSQSSNKKKNGSSQSCVLPGFHFCRLCSTNVRHDEEDLKLHFKKEHKMSVSKYYEQFKGKLRMPRLERPTTTRASVNTNINIGNKDNKLSNLNAIKNNNNNNNKSDNHQTKQSKLKRKSTEENTAVTKKRKSV